MTFANNTRGKNMTFAKKISGKNMTFANQPAYSMIVCGLTSL